MLQDDASVLKRTIDNEIARIESQIASRDNLDRATKILQNRVSELLHLEGEAEKEADTEVQEEAQKQLWAPPKSREEAEEQKDRKRRMRDRARRGALGSLVKQLPEMELEDLDDEVTFDRQQVEALRKHLLHVGMYAQQKGVAPLTREEYFVYVPHVLLPKYEEIPEDIFDDLEEKGLLRVPKDDTGYLADWYEMDDQERHDAVVWYRQERPEEEEGWQGDKVDTSRFEEILVRRRAVRSPGILLDPVLMEGEEELLEDGEDPAKDSSRQKSVRSGDADALVKTSKQKGDESVESPDDSTDKDSKS
jgi:hypothetical protein